MAYSLTVDGYTFENPPERYRKRIRLGNSPQTAVDRKAADFYQSDSQEIQFEVSGTLALDPAVGGTDDLAELERLQRIGIEGGRVSVDFDPFFSGECVIEDDPFAQSESESDYSFRFTVNTDTTDSSAYPSRNTVDTGNTFQLGSLDLGFDPDSVRQNYKRQTQQVKRLQGIARSVDNKGLVPEVQISGKIDGEGQAQLWQKARNNVQAYLEAEFQNGWCLIDSLQISSSQDGPDYLKGSFQYQISVLIVKDPSTGIGNVSSFVDQTVKNTGTYTSDPDSGDGSFSGQEFTVEGGSGSLGDDYIEWNETTVTLSDNDTNYIWVEDSDGDGYGQVKINQSAFPADVLELYEVVVDSGQVVRITDVRSILLQDQDSEEGGSDDSTVGGNPYFTVFGGSYEIVSGTTSTWNDTRLLLESNTRNYVWVEDPEPNGEATVETQTGSYPSSGNFIEMWRVDTDADSVTDKIDDRPADLSDSSSDTSDADLNLADTLSITDQDFSAERLLRLSDTLGISHSGLLPALGLADLDPETLAITEGALDALGITSLAAESLFLDDGGSATGGGGTSEESTTWETASDWDNYSSQKSVGHESYGDLPGADTIQLFYPQDGMGGSPYALWHMHEDSGSTLSDVSGNNRDLTLDSPEQMGASSFLNGTVIDFAQNSTFAYTSNPFFDSSDDFTLIGFINHQSFKNDGVEPIFAQRDDFSTMDYELYIDTKNGGTMELGLGDSISSKITYNIDITTTGTWFMYALRKNGNTYTVDVIDENGNSRTDSASSSQSFDGADAYWYASWQGNNSVDGLVGPGIVYNTPISDSEVQDHFDIISSGFLATGTKSFTESVQPDLDNLTYDLKGESITVDVIGSPGTASEEIISQTLDGSTSYSLSWNDSHTDFRLKVKPSTSTLSTSPTFSGGSLTGFTSGGGDTDQNDSTQWEIFGARYDTSGNEYEGGGVVSRYGG